MNRYREVFQSRHTVLPVIHVDSLGQALRNTQVSRDAGADGVFLINHGMADEALLDIHRTVADAHPDWWIGVNCLGLSPEQVFAVVSGKVAGAWVDNAGIEEGQESQPYADRVLAVRRTRAPNCLYFGGVAFKYQRRVEDLEAACRIAARYVDVVTTSGPGTGHAADVNKIWRMKLALGDTPLAIASGITPENVGNYLFHADSFLVATGVSHSFTELDSSRVRALVERGRAFAGPRDMTYPVRLVSFAGGANFEIDLSAFPEIDPVFAYVDDGRAGVEVQHGLVIDGGMTIENQPEFMWLRGPRNCVLLRATTEGRRDQRAATTEGRRRRRRRRRRRDQRAAFRSLGVGEFCLDTLNLGLCGNVTNAGLKELAPLSKLKVLNLSGDAGVTSEGLKELAPLKRLQDLRLWHTRVTNDGLKHLVALAELKKLDLDGLAVTNEGLKDLAPLKRLQLLNLGSTQVTDQGLKELTAFQDLGVLNLWGTKVGDAGLKDLDLPRLRELTLSKTLVTDKGLKEVARLKGLQTLVLQGTKVTDEGMKHVARLQGLRKLYLDDTQVGNKGLKDLAAFRELELLWLNGTEVTDEGLKELVPLKGLRQLHLFKTMVTNDGADELHKALPNCDIGRVRD
jgi:predicted TIM-barrel enzyme